MTLYALITKNLRDLNIFGRVGEVYSIFKNNHNLNINAKTKMILMQCRFKGFE